MTKKGRKRFTRSAQLFKKSQRHLAGGVSSSIRALNKPVPLFFRSASGSKIRDEDGNQYVDYALAWGPLILGHSHPALIGTVHPQMKKLQTLGAQHQLEITVAEKICRTVPCAELVTFSSTGSEAVQVALRLARAFTGRRKILKFEGHYHGWLDNVLISYHPKQPSQETYEPALTSEGQSRSVLKEICILPWNDLHKLEAALQEHHREIAAIITEPILCNSSCLMPSSDYLEGMRDLAIRYGVVLIFDEVITGFRVSLGGAQSLFRVKPDLATFGKAVAGGFTLSVIAGKREIMQGIVQHRVVHGGTFNGNPISLAAAQATLKILSANQGAALKRVRNAGEALMKGVQELGEEARIPILINGVGSAFHLSFTTRREMCNYRDTLDCDVEARD